MGQELEVSLQQRQLVVSVVDDLSPAEIVAIRNWAAHLLDVRQSRRSRLGKAREAIAVTLKSSVIWPAIKVAARKTKKIGWDERGRTARAFLSASAVSVAVFGGQNAGIAALGTAIGVPLWVVLGSGAAFANLLIEETSRRSRDVESTITTTYKVIDGKRIEPSD